MKTQSQNKRGFEEIKSSEINSSRSKIVPDSEKKDVKNQRIENIEKLNWDANRLITVVWLKEEAVAVYTKWWSLMNFHESGSSIES